MLPLYKPDHYKPGRYASLIERVQHLGVGGVLYKKVRWVTLNEATEIKITAVQPETGFLKKNFEETTNHMTSSIDADGSSLGKLRIHRIPQGSRSGNPWERVRSRRCTGVGTRRPIHHLSAR
jgi:hypothetical protein